MKFFKKKQDQGATIPEDLQPYYNGSETGIKRWIGPVLRAGVLLLILVLLVWAGIALVSRFTGGSDDDKPAQTAQNSGNQNGNTAPNNKPDAQAGTTPTPSVSTSTPSPTPTATPTPRPASTPTPNAAPAPSSTPTPAPAGGSGAGQPQQLANSGPGDIALLFIGVAAAGTLAYRIYLTRKLNAGR